MARKIDVVFNGEKDNGKGYFQIASGYISATNVFFENEDTVAVIKAKGRVEFYDMNDQLLAACDMPCVEDGKQVYQEISCRTEEHLIVIEFPIYTWIDNYPNCDGEHDRWDTRIIGKHTLKFDRLTNTAVCE